MAALQYKVGSQSTLLNAYTAGDTSIVLQTGDGAKFPSTGDFWVGFQDPPVFYLKCTARSGDTLTVTSSATDGTTASNQLAGTKITSTLTAAAYDQLKTDINPVLGTASFDASAGSIASLVTKGCISNVTYTSTGLYAVTFTGSPTNFVIVMQLSNDSGTYVGIPSIVYNSLSSSGFSMKVIQVNGGGFTARDFPINHIAVLKYPL